MADDQEAPPAYLPMPPEVTEGMKDLEAQFADQKEAWYRYSKVHQDNMLPLDGNPTEKLARLQAALEIEFADEPEVLAELNARMAARKDDPKAKELAMAIVEMGFPKDVPGEESYAKLRPIMEHAWKDQPEMFKAFDEYLGDPKNWEKMGKGMERPKVEAESTPVSGVDRPE